MSRRGQQGGYLTAAAAILKLGKVQPELPVCEEERGQYCVGSGDPALIVNGGVSVFINWKGEEAAWTCPHHCNIWALNGSALSVKCGSFSL